MTRDRPYIHYRTAQLEAVLERARSDHAVFTALAYELSLRRTPSAARLRAALAAVPQPPVLPKITAATKPAEAVPNRREQRPAGATPAESFAAVPARPEAGAADRAARLPASDPERVLSTWTALEVLSPQTFRAPEDMVGSERRAVASLAGQTLPWTDGERSRNGYQLYYHIVLGAIRMERATEQLAAAFGADEEQGFRQREKAAIAAVLVDRHGVPVETGAITISSFAWGLPRALRRDLTGLGAWSADEPTLIEELDGRLRRRDRDGNTLPLDRSTIEAAHRWLVQRFGIPAELVEPPAFALRAYHYYRAKNPPEPLLLNSFFLEDLAQAGALARANRLPPALRRYLGAEPVQHPVDLLADRAALEQAVAPAAMPAARWPSPGGHPLVLLQQAAVNLTRAELAGRDGLIAVNGPPGTGKTTLLRDLVAACVLDRALAMAAFDDPAKAFMPSGERVAAGENGYYQLYALHPSLKGHEVLVASSNNKAVENISRELPSVTAVGRPAEDMRYFQTVSDAVHAPRAEAEDEDKGEGVASVEPEAVRTWGLIAAVLGNRSNVAAFQQAFWWDEERSFRLYLKAAKGDLVTREIRHPATGKLIERRSPMIVQAEQPPPSPQAAKEAWQAARTRVLELKREIDAALAELEAVRRLCLALEEARRIIAEQDGQLAELVSRRPDVEAEWRRADAAVRHARDEQAQRAAVVDSSRGQQPGLLARLLRRPRWRTWANAHAPLVEAAATAIRRVQTAQRTLTEATAGRESLASRIRTVRDRLAELRQQAEALMRRIDLHRPVVGDRLIDEHLFTRGHEAANLASPWLPDALQRKRENLFVAALAVHRAFIDAAAQKVQHNLGAMMDVLSNGPPKDDAKRKVLPDLWSTLFLTVPVVSTTFASTRRMLSALPAGSIGWLLVDEAGQALPQAAVGAMARAKRTVVVGDPLQIPPIVTLPKQLTREVCRFFRVDPAAWAAPEASAQTVADRASRFQAVSHGVDGPRRVGVPLLVHRRCDEPMFGIFNRIAYAGRMVQASLQREKDGIGKALGPSRWLDVDGPAETKWCPAEGEAVVALLRKVAAAGETRPDLFILSPFRVVAYELRRRLEQERELLTALGLDARRWVRDRVGTIHTVQGREADSVFLVLGAPKAVQSAARHWAADTPNIVNVAVSRARRNLYVVGSHEAWSRVGCARELAALPVERVGLNDPAQGIQIQAQASSVLSQDAIASVMQQRRGPTP